MRDLFGQRGDVRDLFGFDGEMLDLSGLSWSRPGVLSGLVFRGVRVAGKRLSPEFNDCLSEDSIFEGASSRGGFWGGSNQWRRCVFSKMTLEGPISPLNVFEDCEFKNVELVGYQPYQTLFQGCTFDQLRLTGMKPQTVKNSNQLLSALAAYTAVGVVFDGCTFRDARIVRCDFRGVEMRKCEMANPYTQWSSVADVVADKDYFTGCESGSPFRGRLEEIRDMIRKTVGDESTALRVFDEYLRSYDAGSGDADYSDILYESGIPDDELDRVLEGLDVLEARESGRA